jgi:tRNA(Ile)-lysidine synthase
MSANYSISTILHQFRKLNPNRKKTLIACSGGLDSMVLAHCCSLLKGECQFVLAYVSHGMRSQIEEDLDVVAVDHYTKHWQRVRTVPPTTPIKDEHSARKLRYQELESIAKQYECDYVATAHHADDQLETALINLCRGTCGPKLMPAIRSIASYSPITLIRPCLTVTKESLRLIADERKVPYHEDITNTDTRFTRNRIRQDVIPVLKELYPKCAEHAAQVS